MVVEKAQHREQKTASHGVGRRMKRDALNQLTAGSGKGLSKRDGVRTHTPHAKSSARLGNRVHGGRTRNAT